MQSLVSSTRIRSSSWNCQGCGSVELSRINSLFVQVKSTCICYSGASSWHVIIKIRTHSCVCNRYFVSYVMFIWFCKLVRLGLAFHEPLNFYIFLGVYVRRGFVLLLENYHDKHLTKILGQFLGS